MNSVIGLSVVRFIVQVTVDKLDSNKIVAEEIENVLREYGFKDAQTLGTVLITGAEEKTDLISEELAEAEALKEAEDQEPKEDF